LTDLAFDQPARKAEKIAGSASSVVCLTQLLIVCILVFQLPIWIHTIMRDPFRTTVKGLNTPSPDFMRIVRQIQDKVLTYGICSAQEQAVLERYTDFGEFCQKDSII